ncbi:DUF4123 domain-containing protein [Candidatus Binatia bacterium]|nr:DUF4123 domain-containing protein [Candidatus Binatia bacterium]
MPYNHPDSVKDVLWRPSPRAEPPQVFAILDGARDDRIYPAIEALVEDEEQGVCLLRGELDSDLAAAAPYLLRLDRDAEIVTWLLTQGYGGSWGIFLHAEVELGELRRHLRRFLMVYDHAGKPMYFRYYDPRVLRAYLPTCQAAELEAFFGPVRCYFVEDEEPDRLLEFASRAGETVRVAHGLAGAPSQPPI